MDSKTEYEVTTGIEHGDGYSQLTAKVEPQWTKELCSELPRPSIIINIANNEDEWIVETKLHMLDHYRNDTGRARQKQSQVYKNKSTYDISGDADLISQEREKLEEFVSETTSHSEKRKEQLEEQAKKITEMKDVLTSFTEENLRVMTDLSHHD